MFDFHPRHLAYPGATIYVMILAFTYGTVSALVVTVNQSLAHTLVGAANLLGYSDLDGNEVSWEPCKGYPVIS